MLLNVGNKGGGEKEFKLYGERSTQEARSELFPPEAPTSMAKGRKKIERVNLH